MIIREIQAMVGQMSQNWKWGFALALGFDALLVMSIWLARRLNLLQSVSLQEFTNSVYQIAAPLLIPLLIVSFVIVFIRSEPS